MGADSTATALHCLERQLRSYLAAIGAAPAPRSRARRSGIDSPAMPLASPPSVIGGRSRAAPDLLRTDRQSDPSQLRSSSRPLYIAVGAAPELVKRGPRGVSSSFRPPRPRSS